MTFTRKHMELIAGVVRSMEDRGVREHAAQELGDMLAKSNPNFDRKKFVKACNAVKMVTRRNLMTGKEYQEPEDTPIYCSPAFESYWSM